MSDNFWLLSDCAAFFFFCIGVHASKTQLYADFFDKRNANKSLISPSACYVCVSPDAIAWFLIVIAIKLATHIHTYYIQLDFFSHTNLSMKISVKAVINACIFISFHKCHLNRLSWKVGKIRITHAHIHTSAYTQCSYNVSKLKSN